MLEALPGGVGDGGGSEAMEPEVVLDRSGEVETGVAKVPQFKVIVA